MAGLLFFLGLSLAGQFEIGLTLTSAGGSLAAKQGYTGSFFTGVLAVVVATPCTAPFMGAAIGYALAQPAAVTFAVFTALALGLAAPYVALTLQPAWTRLLPKPGAWMEVLRQAVSVPIFATVIWLAWVLARSLWRSRAGRTAGWLSAARHRRMVPGPLAGAALVERGGGAACRWRGRHSLCLHTSWQLPKQPRPRHPPAVLQTAGRSLAAVVGRRRCRTHWPPAGRSLWTSPRAGA